VQRGTIRDKGEVNVKIEAILSELEFNDGTFPRRALLEAMARKDSITPYLLDIVEDATQNIDELVYEEEYMAPVYAMYLLAQFQERRAYPLIVDFFSIPGEVVLDVTGDVVTEDLNRILASVSGGDTSLIKSLIENEQADGYVRDAALEGLLVLVARGDRTREEVMSYYRELLRGRLERKPSLAWSGLVHCCCHLHPGEVLDDIEQAYREGLVNEEDIGFERVAQIAARAPERVLTELKEDSRYSYIDDTIREMEWWACFEQSLERQKVRGKVGCNQPCPCGSGKKYKKCCGAKR
jgi:hypothetical protein